MAMRLAPAPAGVSPYSDVVVPGPPGGDPVRARLVHRERGIRSRPETVRSRAGRARPAVRRAVLHGRLDHSNLLPPHLSGEAGQVAQRRVLFHRRRRRARGIPPLLAVSSGSGAGDARVAGRGGIGLPSGAAPRGRLSRRWPDCRGSRGCARHGRSASPPSVRALRGRLADRRRDDPAGAAREGAGRRDHAADVHDRLRRGVREHPTVQRRIPRGVSPPAVRRARRRCAPLR